jgi:23S rRNA pseudouridine2605 synthase
VYKPAGVVSTASDPQGRPVVVDLVPADSRVYPVGRLDADTEGLIILTNDGDLADRVTHPRYGVMKTYLARVGGVPSAGTLRKLVEGVDLDDGAAHAARTRLVDSHGGEALVEVVLGEGRKRQVRRMFDAVGHPVRGLVRTGIGPIRDQTLRPGTWRSLSVAEVRSLYMG